MQRQQEGGAAAGASEESSSSTSSGKTKDTTIWGQLMLAKKEDLDKVDVETLEKALLEKALAASTLGALEGSMARLQALLELRLFTATVSKEGRLDLLTYIIEECGIAVNTISEEEKCYIESVVPGEKNKLSACVTTLYSALLGGSQEVIKYLLNRMDKEEVDTRGLNGCTCLMLAAEENNLEAVKRLVLEFDADVDAQCDGLHKPLCYAIKRGHVAVVDFFLEHARSQGGEVRRQALLKVPCLCLPSFSMLFLAIDCHCNDYNTIPLIEYLCAKEGKEKSLYHTFKPTPGMINGMLPLHHAAARAKLPVLKWFFDQGVPVDLATPTDKYTALHASFVIDDEDDMLSTVRYLIEEKHADPTLRTGDGKTAADMYGRFPSVAAYLRKKEQVATRLATRRERAQKAAETSAASEKDMEEATAAAEANAAALVAELEAEEAATKASIDKKKGKSKSKNKNKTRSGRQGKEEREEEKEERSLAPTLQELRITETTTTTISAAEAATAATTTTTQHDQDDETLEDFLLAHAPETLKCPISQELFRHPVTAQDTHTYELEKLQEWIETCARKGNPLRSPVTNALMEPGFVKSQLARTMTLEYIEAKTKEWYETGGGGKKRGCEGRGGKSMYKRTRKEESMTDVRL